MFGRDFERGVQTLFWLAIVGAVSTATLILGSITFLGYLIWSTVL